MNITKENIDKLNSVVRIDITTEDYQNKVESVLKDYRNKANIPGFRKGHVPMSFVKKQYGKSVVIDEVNKLLQDALSNYLIEEKLDVLGNPLPKIKDDFSLSVETLNLIFEEFQHSLLVETLKYQHHINNIFLLKIQQDLRSLQTYLNLLA